MRIELHQPITEELPILRHYIRWLLDAAPQQQLRRILEILFPDPPPRLGSFLHRTLESVTQGSPIFSISVGDNAEALNLSDRTLQRLCQRGHLPGPKRMLLWTGLLYLILVARLNRASVTETASTLGIPRKRFSEVCRELLRQKHSLGPLWLDDSHATLTAFVEECVLPPQKVAEALAALG